MIKNKCYILFWHVDVDECNPSSDCMQKCINSEGSYNCSCNEFFKTDPSDWRKCVGELVFTERPHVFFLSDIFQHANCHLMLTAASEASERAIELSNTSVRRILFVQLPRTYFSLLICKEGKAQVEKDFFRHIGSTASNNGIYL